VLRLERALQAEVGVDGAHPADRAVLDELGDLADGRVEAHPHRLHEEDVPGARGLHQLGRRRQVQRDRLLHQDGLALLDALQRRVQMLRVWRGNVDDVHLGVGGELGVRAVRPGEAEPLGERAGVRGGPRADRGELGAGYERQVLGELCGDPAGADDAPAHLLLSQLSHDRYAISLMRSSGRIDG
jgi:hypothetical protein